MSRRPASKIAGSYAEIDPLVMNYSHLKQQPREAEALQTLRKIASLVKPLMRARGWKVGTLLEFYPDQQNLLGLNQNHGQKIHLRLRYPGDVTQFLPIEQVVDTMLHELAHNRFGPHDKPFNDLWDELRNEYEGLVSKGYTGEGFLSDGRRLGGRSMPQDEANRIRRIAAERRAALTKGSGQKLGGVAVPKGSDMRKVIADAIERRNRITKGCGSGGNKTGAEVEALSDQASKNGFKTQAEEDEANETAISQALWDLHQEDEKKKYGKDYAPPSMSSGFKPNPNFESLSASPRGSVNKENPFTALFGPQPGNPDAPTPSLPAKRPAPSSPPAKLQSKSDPTVAKDEKAAPPKFWTCLACTFAENPILHLCCDICNTECPAAVARSIIDRSARPANARLANARPAKKASNNSGSLNALAALSDHTSKIWLCHICSTRMESQWWTCSTCGTFKQSSKD